MARMKCKSCGAPIDTGATECKYCREPVDIEPPKYEQQSSQRNQHQEPQYQAQQQYQSQPQYQQTQYQQPPIYLYESKSRVIAAVLAITFGWIGVHKFYLGKTGAGILSVLFFWTGIPCIVGLIEAIFYLTSSKEKFYWKYVR
jgi:hypothetical protein